MKKYIMFLLAIIVAVNVSTTALAADVKSTVSVAKTFDLAQDQKLVVFVLEGYDAAFSVSMTYPGKSEITSSVSDKVTTANGPTWRNKITVKNAGKGLYNFTIQAPKDSYYNLYIETPRFSDISGHWAESIINEAAEQGIIQGFDDGTFRPDDIVTGEQFMALLFRTFAETFTPPNSEPTIRWNQKLLQRIHDINPLGYNYLRDATIKNKFTFQQGEGSNWAKPYIDMYYDMKLIQPYDLVFKQGSNAFTEQLSRERVGYLISNWLVQYDQAHSNTYEAYVASHAIKDFGDFTQGNCVSCGIGYAFSSGVMRGYPDGNFYPHRYVTRAEAAAIIIRMRDSDKRDPYKPDMSTLDYSVGDNGMITLFTDHEDYVHYSKMKELADKYLTQGTIVRSGIRFTVWQSAQEAKQGTWLAMQGLGNEYGSHFQTSFAIDYTSIVAGAKSMSLQYYTPRNIKSDEMIDAMYAYWVGEENVKEFKGLVSAGSDFKFLGKSFLVLVEGDYTNVSYLYPNSKSQR